MTYSFVDPFVCSHWHNQIMLCQVFRHSQIKLYLWVSQNEVPQQIYNIFSNSWNLYYPPISCIKKTIVWTKTGLIYVYSPLSLSYYPKIRDKFYSISKRNVIKRIFLISKFMTAATIQSYISLWKSHHGQHCSLKSDESKVTAWREIQWKTDTEYCSKFCK